MKNLYLKAIRNSAGKTQTDCAKAAGVSAAGYARVEAGLSTLNPQCWRKLASYLSVSVEALTDPARRKRYENQVSAILKSSLGR